MSREELDYFLGDKSEDKFINENNKNIPLTDVDQSALDDDWEDGAPIDEGIGKKRTRKGQPDKFEGNKKAYVGEVDQSAMDDVWEDHIDAPSK